MKKLALIIFSLTLSPFALSQQYLDPDEDFLAIAPAKNQANDLQKLQAQVNALIAGTLKTEKAKKEAAAAANKLGVWYEKGKGGVLQNYQKAYEHYSLAASYNNGYAMHNLGDLYKQGLGVERSPMTAFSWYQRASKYHPIGWEDMADCYLNGFGVEQNRAKAIELYKKAAEKGRKSALKKLANLAQ